MPELLEHVTEEHLPALQAPLEGRLVPTPYNFNFTGEDALRLTVHNSQTGVVVAVHWRMQTPDQRLVANRFAFTPATDRSPSVAEFTIGDGYLLNVTLLASSGSPKRGQTYVRLQVIRGRGAAAVVLGAVVQGYVTGNQDRAWPGSALEGSLEGDGVVRVIVGTDPAAGTEFVETVPTGARWQLLTVRLHLVTSAAAGSRRTTLFVNSGTTIVWYLDSNVDVPPSSARNVTWAEGLPFSASTVDTFGTAPLPAGYILAAAAQIKSTTLNLDAGDNYNVPALSVREWLEAQ